MDTVAKRKIPSLHVLGIESWSSFCRLCEENEKDFKEHVRYY
jgi:hypothetical protein